MTRITENTIEDFAIKLLEGLGYAYVYAPNIAPDSKNPERSTYEEVLLNSRMTEAVQRINPTVPVEAQEEAIKEMQRIHSPELLTNNESFHRMLTGGKKVSYQKDGNQRGDLVWFIDFNTPENNDFVVANQFTVIEDGINKRPDVVLFVNGIPLVVIELKNAVDDKATIKSAWNQIETYKATIPGLFTYNAFTVISDGLEARAGTISSGLSRFMKWKTSDGKTEASGLIPELETLIKGMLNKETLLDLIQHFIVFEKSKKEDAKTGVTTITTVKKLAAYHQYYAVNRAVESVLRAVGKNPLLGGVPEGRGGSFPTNIKTPQIQRESITIKKDNKNSNENNLEHQQSFRRKILPYNPKLKELARKLRKNMTLSEVLLWNELKQKKMLGIDFDRQCPIDEYIVDFYCKDLMLAVEIDGNSHDYEEVAKKDKRRQQRLESMGVRFLRFDDIEVKKNMRNVLLSIQYWIEAHGDDFIGREPTPNPSKEGNIHESPESYGLTGV
ncbi:MAG: DUF559 domain-containing protein, partial [Chitinophagaceae bacterium]